MDNTLYPEGTVLSRGVSRGLSRGGCGKVISRGCGRVIPWVVMLSRGCGWFSYLVGGNFIPWVRDGYPVGVYIMFYVIPWVRKGYPVGDYVIPWVRGVYPVGTYFKNKISPATPGV